MGSLKRKNASLPASASSSKRASRDDPSSVGPSANGCTGRRGGHVSSSSSSPATSAAAAAPALASTTPPTSAPLANGVSSTVKTNPDTAPSSTSSNSDKKPSPQDLVKAEDKDPAIPSGSKDHDADGSPRSELADPKKPGSLIPNHAGWFSWNSIHPVEQRGLPDFFNAKSKLKTPELYMEYRNHLIRKYLEEPEKLFTVADISNVISDQKEGHVEAAKRIFVFLDHWGLINSRALGNSEADASSKPKHSVAEGSSSGQSLTNLYRFDSPSSTRKHSRRINSVIPPAIENAVAELQGGVQDTSVEYHCNSCSADCSKRRFHCQKQADFDLCPECYNEGKFSYGITNTDFILMEAVADANGCDGWSDQETLLLLEALELYGDNFSEIAEHVGTKTKAQCILHFIRLPIEDPFLDGVEFSSLSNAQLPADPTSGNKIVNPAGQEDDANQLNDVKEDMATEDTVQDGQNKETVGDCDIKDKNSDTSDALITAAQAAGLVGPEKSLAFSECGNPVMALMTFLAALVPADVAMVSAQAALKMLAEKASALQLADENSFNLEVEPDIIKPQRDDRQPEELAQLESQSETKSVEDVPSEKNNSTNEGNAPIDSVTDFIKGSPLVKVKNAATTALASAAVKAKFLADQEEWEIMRLTAFVVDSQIKKIDAKLKLIKELDMALEKEHTVIERSKQRLLVERSHIAMARSAQTVSSSQLPNPMSRMPFPLSRLAPGFNSPMPTGNFIAYGTNDPLRSLAMPQVRDSPGINTMPIRSLPFNNSQY